MPETKRGLIRTIFLVIIAILILSYFRINLRELLDIDNWRQNLFSVWQFLKMVWRDFLAPPIIFLLEKLLEMLRRALNI